MVSPDRSDTSTITRLQNRQISQRWGTTHLKPPLLGMPVCRRHLPHGHAAGNLFLLPPVTSPCVQRRPFFIPGHDIPANRARRAARHDTGGRRPAVKGGAGRSPFGVRGPPPPRRAAPLHQSPLILDGYARRRLLWPVRPAASERKAEPAGRIELDGLALPSGCPPRRRPLPVTH
jgi:hypothetical protein